MKTNFSHSCFRPKKKEPFLLNSKFIAVFFIVSLLLPLLAIAVSSHPGRTDSNGGHYNRSTGEYHYHHGYPAHQHINGVCPYSSDAKTTTKETTDKLTASNSSGKYTTEAQYALMTAKDKDKDKNDDNNKTQTKSFYLLNDPKFLMFAGLVVSVIASLTLAVILWRKNNKMSELNDNLNYYKREDKRLTLENAKLKEDLRLKTVECEDIQSDNRRIQYKCDLYKIRSNYLFVTKHLCNPDYERFYLDSLSDLEQLTVSPFDTMNQVAPMVADYLLISVKQAEESLNKSTRYSDKTRAVKIADIRKETQELLTKYIQNQYQLEYLLRTFPNLNYLVFVEAPYRNSEIYMQTKENIAKALPSLKKPTQARWNEYFNICMHHLFEFGSPPVYEMIFQKLVAELEQMEQEDFASVWDLNMQVSSLSLLFAISEALLKTAIDFSFSENNQITEALRNFAKQCLSAQLDQGGITDDVYDSLLSRIEKDEGNIE